VFVGEELNRRSLHCATPNFLSGLVGSANFMRPRRNKSWIKPPLVFGKPGSTTKRRVPHPLRSLQRVGYATVGIEIRGIPPFAKSAKDGAPGTRRSGGCRKLQIPRLRSPGFPVKVGGFLELHAPFLTERRTRCRVRCCVTGNPGRDDKG